MAAGDGRAGELADHVAGAGLVLGAVFGAGLLGGVALERHFFAGPPRVASPQEAHASALSSLVEALELDEEQTEQVHEIIAANHRVVQESWEELRPQVQSAMTNAGFRPGSVMSRVPTP